MALYKHVANKDELLDAMVDIVFSQIELPAAELDWRSPCETVPRRRARRSSAIAGDRTDGIATPGAGKPAQPQRRHGLPARCRILVRNGSPRLLGPGRLHLRLRPPRARPRIRDTAVSRSSRTEEGGHDRRPRRLPYLAEVVTKLPETGYDNALEFVWDSISSSTLEQLRHTAGTPADHSPRP